MSTRKAYGMALAKLGRYNERVVAMDSDTNNFTYSEIFKNEHPNRFVECYLAQQNMVGPPKITLTTSHSKHTLTKSHFTHQKTH